MDEIFRSSNSRVSEGLYFWWGAAGGGKRSIQKRVVCKGLVHPFEMIRKAREGYVVREQPARMTTKVGFRNECIRFFGYTRRPHTIR